MALIDLKSKLSNYRSNFTTPSVDEKNKPAASELNLDKTPAKYNGKTQFRQSFIEASLYDRAEAFILKYTGRTKFTQNYVKTSKLNLDQTLQYNTSTKFTTKVVNTSLLNRDEKPSKFSPNTKYTPTKFYPEGALPKIPTRWAGTNPPAVNFISDTDAKGFTTNLGKSGAKDKSQFNSFVYKKAIPTGNSKYDFGDATMAKQLGTGSPFPQFPGAEHLYNWLPTAHTGFTSSATYSSKAGKEGFLKPTYTTNSPIDDMYKKFNLRDEAFNPTYMPQPLILRGLQRKGKEEPQRWGFGANFDDGLIRGGVVTALERAAMDTVRIAKWMASPKGLLWVVKQVGLGLTNPKVEAIGGPLSRQTRIHTGVTSLLSVVGSPFGLHFTRHGLPFLNETASYENVQRIKTIAPSLYKNRLDSLRSSLFNSIKLPNANITDLKDVKHKSLIFKGAPIVELSGLAGPNSVYGIGTTTIRRHTDTQSDAVLRALDSGFIQTVLYGDSYAGNLRANTKNPNDSKYPGDNRGIDKIDSETNYYSLRNKHKDSDVYNPVAIRDLESQALIDRKTFGDKLTIGNLRATTGHTYDANNDTIKRDVAKYDAEGINDVTPSLRIITENLPSSTTPGAKTSNTDTEKLLDTNFIRSSAYPGAPVNPINEYVTLAYNKIPKSTDIKSFNDFRANIADPNDLSDVQKGLLGARPENYHTSNNLQAKYGFGNPGEVGADRSKPNQFLVAGTNFNGTKANRKKLIETAGFRGDKVTALDVVTAKDIVTKAEVYPDGANDLIKFYFEDGNQGYNVMPFRCTMTGFSDSFSPGWDRIDIMGRPDGAYLYNSFERSISFTFMVAALSRSEMIPMWRKLNQLASYTMPDFGGGGKPAGPFMRITIGHMFQQTPGFITSLSYTVPDDATWDIAEDDDNDAKQLPMVVEANVSMTIVGDFRPQLGGRVYSLFKGKTKGPGDWLADAQ